MAAFKDRDGHSWLLEVDALAVRRIRQLVSVDLLDLEGDTWRRIDADLCLRVDVLWALCEEQASKRGIDQRAFARLLTGDGLANATEGLLDAVVEFFPPERRSLLSAMWRKSQALLAVSVRTASAKLDDPAWQERAEQAIAEQVDKAMSEALTHLGSVSSSPASSASHPGG